MINTLDKMISLAEQATTLKTVMIDMNGNRIAELDFNTENGDRISYDSSFIYAECIAGELSIPVPADDVVKYDEESDSYEYTIGGVTHIIFFKIGY